MNGNLTVASGANFTAGTGTLSIGNGTSSNNSISNLGILTFNNLTVAANANVTSSGNFTVSGTMTVNGVFGPAARNTITVTNSGGAATVAGTIASGGTASGLTFSNGLTLSGGSTSTFTLNAATGTGNPLINVSGGTFTVGSKNTITLTQGSFGGAGTYDLFHYAGADPGTGNFTLTANLLGNYGYYLYDNAANKEIDLLVTLPTTTTVSSSLTASAFGQSVTFTATVSATGFDNGGTLTFSDGSLSLGTGSLSSGQATFSTAGLSAVTHTITASYSGDTNFTASSNGALQTVTAASTSTSVTSSTTASVFGQSVTFTATVTPQVANTFDNGGTVTFSDGSTSLGTATLSGSSTVTATFSTTVAHLLSGGTHTITASYSGDTNFTLSSNSMLQTVNTASTSTTVSASTNVSVFGQSVTFTATVTATSVTFDNGGTVTFSDGTTSLGTVGLSGSNKVTYTYSALTVSSSHSIIASYSGDTNFTLSSGSVLQTVNRASTTTTVTYASPESPVFGQSVTFTATVQAAGQGSGTPSGGTVTFSDGSISIGTGSVTGGTATYSTTATQLPAATGNITASYDGTGDANFTNSAASANFTLTVAKASTSTSLMPLDGTLTFGQTVTFTATVSNASAGAGSIAAPEGLVTFSDGSTSLGTASLSTANDTSATATFTTSSLSDPSNPHTLTAAYYGDSGANFAASAVSNSATQTVTLATTTTTVTSSTGDGTSVFGQPVTFTATVGPQYPDTFDGGGTVTFSDGSTSLGTASLSSSGQATYSAPSSVIDLVTTHTITASYSGDTNFTDSSNSMLQTVTQATTTTTLAVSPNPSAFGETVTFTATVTAGSFDDGGTVTFSDGSTSLGTASLSSSGQATYSAPSSVIDLVTTHTITASYSGDTNFSDSSNSMLQTVNQASTSVTITQSTPNPVVAGNSVTFTASVSFTAGAAI